MIWEFLLLPGIFLILVVVFGFISSKTDTDFPRYIALLAGLAFFISILVAPALMFESRQEVITGEAYWASFIEPNIIEDNGEYVVVSGLEQGVWQAGNWNLASYNRWLADIRWQDSIPIYNSVIYRPPDYLKPAMVK